MKKILLASFMLLMLPAITFAAGPVNPTAVEVDAPTTSADGTPINDLDAVDFCVYSDLTGPLLACVEVDSPTPSPRGVVTLSTPIAAFNLSVDGQYTVDSSAVDTAGNRSARTARAPFDRNQQAPSAPSTPRYR